MVSWLQDIHLGRVYVVMVTGDTFGSCLCCHGYRGYILGRVYVVMVTGDTFGSCLCCHGYRGYVLGRVYVVMVTGDIFGSCLCCHGYKGYIWVVTCLAWELVKVCLCQCTSLISSLQAIAFASTVANLLGFSLPIPLCISDMMEAHWVVLLSYVSPILALITIVIYAVA